MTRNSTAAPRRDPKTGTWRFVVDLGIGQDGRRRQAYRRGFPTKKAAQEALDEVRGSVTTQSYVAPAKSTVGEYLARWIDGLPTTGLRPSTVDGYRRNVAYVTPTLGGRRLDQLTATDLDRLYSQLLVSGLKQREGGLSPRSVRYIHVVVHKALGDAVRKKELRANVAADASPPSAKSTRPKEMAWWTPQQLRIFLDLTAGESLGQLFRFAAMTGMRRGEACGVRWSDVDLDAGRVEVRQQLVVVRGRDNGGLMFSERTKTDHGRRTVDLDPGTVAMLRRHRRDQRQQKMLLGSGWRNDANGLVFTDAEGAPLDPESVAKVFDRRVARSGLPRLRFHDLRHTHVAHLIATGEQPLLIARRLGHASAAFTQDRYGHLFHDAGSQAASAVAAMVDGST